MNGFVACSFTFASQRRRLIFFFLRVVIQMGILANMQISHTFALIYFVKSTHDTFNRIQIESIYSIPRREGISTFWARLNDVDAEYRERRIKRRNLPRFRCDNQKSGMNIIILILLIPLGVVFYLLSFSIHGTFAPLFTAFFPVILWFRIILSFSCHFFLFQRKIWNRDVDVMWIPLDWNLCAIRGVHVGIRT